MNRFPREVRARARVLYLQGYSKAAIARELGVKRPGTIYKWAEADNWDKIRAETEALAAEREKEEISEQRVKFVQDYGKTLDEVKRHVDFHLSRRMVREELFKDPVSGEPTKKKMLVPALNAMELSHVMSVLKNARESRAATLGMDREGEAREITTQIEYTPLVETLPPPVVGAKVPAGATTPADAPRPTVPVGTNGAIKRPPVVPIVLGQQEGDKPLDPEIHEPAHVTIPGLHSRRLS